MSIENSVEGLLNKTADLTVKDPALRTAAAWNAAPFLRKPLAAGISLVKEPHKIPFNSGMAIVNWTARSIFKLIGKTVGLGVDAAMLAPVIPGLGSVAALRNNVTALTRTIDSRATHGTNNESFGDHFDRMRGHVPQKLNAPKDLAA